MFHPKSASAKLAREKSRKRPRPIPGRAIHLRPEKVNETSDDIEFIAPPDVPPPRPFPVSVTTSASPVLGRGALNTHFFDGKLDALLPFIANDLVRAAAVPRNERMTMFTRLLEKVHTTRSPLKTRNSERCLKTIIDCYEYHERNPVVPNQNWDPVNKLLACDLLYLLCEKICIERNEQYFALLLTQLDEMATGMCPQGRTTRLFQVLLMLMEKLE